MFSVWALIISNLELRFCAWCPSQFLYPLKILVTVMGCFDLCLYDDASLMLYYQYYYYYVCCITSIINAVLSVLLLLYYVPWTQINNFSCPRPSLSTSSQVSRRCQCLTALCSPLIGHQLTLPASDGSILSPRWPLIGWKLTNSWPMTWPQLSHEGGGGINWLEKVGRGQLWKCSDTF